MCPHNILQNRITLRAHILCKDFITFFVFRNPGNAWTKEIKPFIPTAVVMQLKLKPKVAFKHTECVISLMLDGMALYSAAFNYAM